ncbi:NADH dehydrogenase [ubiquinone] 1 beta subcomplex subunit 10-like [Cimex lectularius]|nr:NADH dehydrogenase [ubiquinone] 1 beta subcomplex subunit 10-like [Cimex lectularius]
MGADSNPKDSPFMRFCFGVVSMVEGPVVWFRKNIVEPNRKEYNWYHEKLRRVPTIDQCYDDDPLCKFEANQQFKRDK